MARQRDLTPRNPFNNHACLSCGKSMGSHWVFRPDKLTDVIGGAGSRKTSGKHYCHRDGLGYSTGHYQRVLRREMDKGYAESIGIRPKEHTPAGYAPMKAFS